MNDITARADALGNPASTPSAAVSDCPCCDGIASGNGKVHYGETFAKEQGWSQSTFYYCNCMICGVSNLGLRGYETPEAAIKAWNRRPSPKADGAKSMFLASTINGPCVWIDFETTYQAEKFMTAFASGITPSSTDGEDGGTT